MVTRPPSTSPFQINNVKEQKPLPDRKSQSPDTFVFQAVCRTGHFVSVRQGDLYMVGYPTVSRPFSQPSDLDNVAAFLQDVQAFRPVSVRAARPVGERFLGGSA